MNRSIEQRKRATGFLHGSARMATWTCGGLLFGAVVSSCSGGSTGPSIGPPASVTVVAGDNQTARAGTAVAVMPSVRVQDADGNAVSGQAVVFAVSGGGGSVSGGSATTDDTGTATVGGWTLGATPGTNTLRVTAGTVSATVTATGTAGPPAALTVVAGDDQTGEVGAAVAIAPSVRVEDADGNPVSGQSVVFAVTEGGGSVTGGNATTNASGTATVGAWTLGTTPGTNTLQATAAGVSVAFTATSTRGPAATIVKEGGEGQSAGAGFWVPVNPSVRVTDQYGNVIPDANLTFAPDVGGRARPSEATTDEDGHASTEWLLGEQGANSLTVAYTGSVGEGGGPVPPVTFAATSLDPCANYPSIEIPRTIENSLSSLDCEIYGAGTNAYADQFTLSLPQQTLFQARYAAAGFGPALVGLVQGVQFVGTGAASGEFTVHFILPGDDYTFIAFSVEGNQGQAVAGDYTLDFQGWDGAGCALTSVVDGVDYQGEIRADDCSATNSDTNGEVREDPFLITLPAGGTLEVTVTPEFRAVLGMETDQTLERDGDIAPGETVTLTHVFDAFAFVYVRLGGQDLTQTGAYDIEFHVTPPGGAAAARAASPRPFRVAPPLHLPPAH